MSSTSAPERPAQTRSVWQQTRTFFPMFIEQIQATEARVVCVIGASDGKFVLPLAHRGIQVIAIERDKAALDGGPITLPGPVSTAMPGLRQRLAEENLADHVDVIPADLLDMSDLPEADAVWTSCSWHYSANHRKPVGDFVAAMTRICPAGGSVLGAEYMMPVQPEHYGVEHYMNEGDARRCLPGWTILLEAHTPPFVEEAHVGQLSDHIHRMGVVIAQRPQDTGGETP
jgi:hypothetical protein